MKLATVFLRRKVLLIHPSSRTTDGVWIMVAPCAVTPESTSDADLGGMVERALAQSTQNVPHPQQWGGLLKPLLSAAGVKSWRTFAEGAVCVQVQLSCDEVRAIPTENLGAKEGFQPDAKRQVCVPWDGDRLVLGRAIRDALQASR